MYNYPIFSKIFGKGKSFVLFLHGWGGSTNSFLPVAKKIAIEHKVVLVDFYGFGKSKFPNYCLDTYEYAIQLYLFLKNKNITELSIVAHSFGGRVAMILSSVFDIKINELILVGSAGILPKRTLSYRFKILKFKLYKKLLKFKFVSDKKLSNFGSDEYKQLSGFQKLSFVKVVNQGLEYMLKNITARTLVVWGENDVSTPMYMAHKINKLINKSKLIIYENSGHFCYMENYGDFCALLLTFLKG